MAVPAEKLEVESFMEPRTALEERVHHIQNDVAEMKGDIRRLNEKVDAVRTELGEEIASLRTELKAEIGSVRTELKAEIASLRSEQREEIKSVREEIASVREDVTSVRQDVGALRGELKDALLNMTRWMIGTALTTATLAFVIARFVGGAAP